MHHRWGVASVLRGCYGSQDFLKGCQKPAWEAARLGTVARVDADGGLPRYRRFPRRSPTWLSPQ